MTHEELEVIRNRAEKATKAIWYVSVDGSINARSGDFNWGLAGVFEKNDADFIAHAREDIPLLLAEIERLKAKE